MIPSFNFATLKLISNSKCFLVNSKYVNNCALCIGKIISTDFTSSMTKLFINKSILCNLKSTIHIQTNFIN